MNRISFLNRGYAFKGLLAVTTYVFGVKIRKIGTSLHPNFFYKHVYNSVLRPLQDYFSSYETGQSVGRAKTGEPREKPHLAHPQAYTQVLLYKSGI